MHDTQTYQIQVRGRVDAKDLDAGSPLRIADVREEGSGTGFTVYGDQAALVGLMRHLHGRGFVLLSVRREQ